MTETVWVLLGLSLWIPLLVFVWRHRGIIRGHMENRPNFELIQISDDEYHVISLDGSIVMRVAAKDVPHVRRMIDDPMSIFLENEP